MYEILNGFFKNKYVFIFMFLVYEILLFNYDNYLCSSFYICKLIVIVYKIYECKRLLSECRLLFIYKDN